MGELLEKLINRDYCELCNTKQEMSLVHVTYGEFEKTYYCNKCKRWYVTSYNVEKQIIYTQKWDY